MQAPGGGYRDEPEGLVCCLLSTCYYCLLCNYDTLIEHTLFRDCGVTVVWFDKRVALF